MEDEAPPPPPKPPPPPLPPHSAKQGKRKEQLEEETTGYEAPAPPPPPPPEIPMPVDRSLRGGHVEEEISTVWLGFSLCFADKTRNGDGGKRVTRRRTRSTRGVGGGAQVIGLGNEVQRRCRRCPLRSPLREKEKIIIGLERSSGVSGLRMM